jgi:hypothetical protein
MEYKYLIEEKANINIEFENIKNENEVCLLNILCYSIEDQHKYPFLQFMMEKVPFCNGIINEQLTLPYVFIRNSNDSLKDLVLERVRSGLKMLGCDFKRVSDDMYKGVIYGEDNWTPFAFVNITGIDIYGLNFMRQTNTWFVLPSEIINTKKVCNIEVDIEVTHFFSDHPNVALITDLKTNNYYMLPDAVYTGNEIKQVEFNSIFGNFKTKSYNSCSEYYYFYRTFGDAVKDGGWLKDGKSNKIGERVIVENDCKKYICGGINRYALFVEGKIYLESNTEFSLTDNIIESLYPEPCIIICYSGKRDIKPDILVKNYESFVCLSYHKLNKSLLDETFIEKKQYMIA